MTLNERPQPPVLQNYEMSEDDESCPGFDDVDPFTIPKQVLSMIAGEPSDVSITILMATSLQLDRKLGLEPVEIGLPELFPFPKKVIIMNASGPGTATERRKLIADVLSNTPDIILFQEFKWKRIGGRAWKDTPFPENYVYTGHKEASIMYDGKFQLKSLPSSNLQAPLEELKWNGEVSYDFAPFSRICIRLLETEPDYFKLLIVSWHGVHRDMKNDEKKNQFQCLQVYLMELSKQEDAAVLLGGDFNIEMSLIKDLVKPEFILYPYTASPHREGKVIDYFIASEALDLTDVGYIDLTEMKRSKDDTEDDTRTRDPYPPLDHDPIIAHMTRKDKDLWKRLLNAILTVLVSVWVDLV